MSFDWDRKRNIQTMTTNKIIETVQMSPKEVVAAGGNRIQLEQVTSSLCAIAVELIRLEEERTNRINTMYDGVKNDRTGNQHGEINSTNGNPDGVPV